MGPLRPGSGRFYRPRPQNDNTEASQQRLFVFAEQVSKPLHSPTRAQNNTNTTVTARASEAWSIRQTEAAPSHQKHQPAVGLISCRHGYWHLAAVLKGWGTPASHISGPNCLHTRDGTVTTIFCSPTRGRKLYTHSADCVFSTTD